jgi:hypothetical protein
MITTLEELFSILNNERQQARLDICNTCEHKIKITNMCGKCGCFLPAKVTLAIASCPELRWTSEISQESSSAES